MSYRSDRLMSKVCSVGLVVNLSRMWDGPGTSDTSMIRICQKIEMKPTRIFDVSGKDIV